MALRIAEGAPLPVAAAAQAAVWQGSTGVLRERQNGDLWCWAACAAMVLKAFGLNREQCAVNRSVCNPPCTPAHQVMAGCDRGYPVTEIVNLWADNGVNAMAQGARVGWDMVKIELDAHRPLELFLGSGDTTSADGHLVLIIGGKETAAGRKVLIADPLSIHRGTSPVDFDSLERFLDYGRWELTWTNLSL